MAPTTAPSNRSAGQRLKALKLQIQQRKALQRQARLRTLVYAYVILLIIEGALRKWLLPPLAGPLLLVRDPIAMAIIWFSWRQGLWYSSLWLRLWLPLTTLMIATGLLALLNDDSQPISILLYGLRTACLHLPLILLFPRILNGSDVAHIGRVFLAIALPIALLMVWQYRSPASDLVNATTVQGGSLLTAVAGKVRPPGPFSFNTGVAEYYAMLNGFLLAGFFNQTSKPLGLGIGLAATLIASAVSGSRLMLAYTALVWLVGGAFLILLRPERLNGRAIISIATASLLALAVLVLNPFGAAVDEGRSTTNERVEQANEFDGGVAVRGLRQFEINQNIWEKTPAFGRGLGMGTNFAGQRYTGEAGFLLDENEWPRVIQESGIVVGSLYILYRIGLCLSILLRSLQALRLGTLLPLGLTLAGIHLLLFGAITRPTTMGFAVVSLGLALTAAEEAFQAQRAPLA